MTLSNGAQLTTLSVANFGPIAEAEVELRPLSVFIGPSNTGKSYMAVLIYALHRFFAEYSSNVRLRRTLATGVGSLQGQASTRDRGYNLSPGDVETVLEWASEMNLVQPPRSRLALTNNELPESIASLIRPTLKNIGQYSEAFDDEIARCFGVEEIANLIRHPGSSDSRLSLELGTQKGIGHEDAFRHVIKISSTGSRIDASIPDNVPLRIGRGSQVSTMRFPRWQFQREPSTEAEGMRQAASLLGVLSGAVISSMIDPVVGTAYYLPADRAGVMHAHRVVVRSLISRASRAGLRPEPALPALSGVLGDFLEQLIDMADNAEDRENSFLDPSTRLERTILQGSVLIEQGDSGYPSFAYRPGNWDRDLPLMNASSMVSEMAPVVLYLRHLVAPNDLLIIEEPESHLHPEMQVAFTRELASIAKSGIQVIITTHSEWVLEELANLVLLSELPEKARTGIPGADSALTSADIGAWLFEPSPESGSSTVQEIRLDKDSGTFPARYGVVTEELYNRFATISNRIEELQCHQK